MIEIRQTDEYERWFETLRDRAARVRIDLRIRRLSLGNPGSVEPIGEGLSELKIDFGPGYRVYYLRQAGRYVLLLIGGDKSSQARDIRKAKELALKYTE